MIGETIAHYEITGSLGAGGMGEVYRARDTKLERDVAIKILPESFAADAGRVARFEQEAKTLASLNHTNIAQVYGFERVAGKTAIIMELVDGPTLADRIAQGPLPADEAMSVARQIADALEAAHEQNIIHRDLKPANVKLKPDGAVKVLDFGIAKALVPELGTSSGSPIMTTPVTQVGVILGTAAYMSPEQARGKRVDKRADIWAFGCVLYEMLTGQLAFGGEDVAVILARVIANDTDLKSLPAAISPAVQRTIELCLQKDPRKRLRDIGDVKLALAGAFETETTGGVGAGARGAGRTGRSAVMVAGAAAVAALAAAAAVWLALQPPPAAVSRTSIALAPGVRIGISEFDANVAISRDGRLIAFAAGSSASGGAGGGGAGDLYVRRLDALEPRLVTNAGRTPFFSPDGEWMGFVGSSGALQKTTTTGGPIVPMGGVTPGPRGATWGPAGIVVGSNEPATGLLLTSASEGTIETLTMPDAARGESDHIFPRLLPDGRHVLFTIASSQGVDRSQIALVDIETREYRVLIQGGSDAQYVASGHIVYGAAGVLFAVPFDLASLEVRGTPVPVVDDVATKATGAVSFAVADNGTLAYISGGAQNFVRLAVVWVDRNGVEESLDLPPRNYQYVQLSPDGQRLALDVREEENDIWIWDLERRSLQRLTFDPALNRGPAWSGDGRRVAFSRSIEGKEEVYWQSWDGAGVPEQLTRDSPDLVMPNDVSADDRYVFVFKVTVPRDVLMVPTEGAPTTPVAIISTPASEENATLSPDGRWLAYQSDESGRNEIYVRPFPEVESGRWQVSTGGGIAPRWSRNGLELFYYYNDGRSGRLMAVDVDTSTVFRPGAPRLLFEGPDLAPQQGRQIFDVSLDDQRFLMIKRAETSDADAPESQLIVVQNWFEELKRLAPTP
jgi:serine/threonine-protein kinase